MKTLKSVNIVPEYVDLMPDYDKMQEAVLYISEEREIAIHKCLCGCGNETVTPLGGGENWEIVKGNGTVSLIGSVGNFNFPCKSHYIITANKANFV